MSIDVSPLARALEATPTPNLLVVTGAGISLASGIPTFRGPDPGAVWSESVMTLGTRAFFERDPVESWRWYTSRFGKLHDKLPNPGHRALVELEGWYRERGGPFLLVTQNIDGLHRRAGSQELVEVHGTADRVRCAREGCSFGAPDGSLPREAVDFASFVADPSPDTLPTCPGCGDLVRAHVLWFDETYDGHRDFGYDRVMEAAESFDLILFVGTSFSVGVTELLLHQALLRECPMFVIDPGEGPDLSRYTHYRSWPNVHEVKRFPPPRLTHLPAASEVVLPELCRALGVPARA
ncbi:MAG: RNA polymerase subunit sigma [Planctomycetes bacterium]|nr:RNA polymerase subunit sigma [Planctomycetota bacterium]